MNANYVLRFDLPVGAILGGCRHIGGGGFEGLPSWDTSQVLTISYAPTVFEVNRQQHEPSPDDVVMDVVENAQAGKAIRRCIARGHLRFNGKVCNEIELANELGGMTEDEYRAHLDLVFPPTAATNQYNAQDVTTWPLAAYGTIIRGDESTPEDQIGAGVDTETAERLVACWNYCLGISNEELRRDTRCLTGAHEGPAD